MTLLKKFLYFCAFIGFSSPAMSINLKGIGLSAGVGANFANAAGINVRYSFDQIELMTAFGGNDHYSIGLRYNLFRRAEFWQPRIALNYGTNGDLDALYKLKDGHYEYEFNGEGGYSEGTWVSNDGYRRSYNGLSLTIGTRLAFGRRRQQGLAIDIGYRLTDGGYSADRRRYLRNNSTGNHGEGGMMGFGYLFGVFGGGYNLQFSLGWEMKF